MHLNLTRSRKHYFVTFFPRHNKQITIMIFNYWMASKNAWKGNEHCIFTLYEVPTRHSDRDNRKPLHNVQSNGIGNKESRPIINSPWNRMIIYYFPSIMLVALFDAINYRRPTVLRYFAAVCRNVLYEDNAYELNDGRARMHSSVNLRSIEADTAEFLSRMVIMGFLLLSCFTQSRQLLS